MHVQAVIVAQLFSAPGGQHAEDGGSGYGSEASGVGFRERRVAHRARAFVDADVIGRAQRQPLCRGEDQLGTVIGPGEGAGDRPLIVKGGEAEGRLRRSLLHGRVEAYTDVRLQGNIGEALTRLLPYGAGRSGAEGPGHRCIQRSAGDALHAGGQGDGVSRSRIPTGLRIEAVEAGVEPHPLPCHLRFDNEG